MAYIISSGITSDGIILENDSMTVLDGGVATDTTVNSGGSMIVSYGGTANNTIVNYSGTLCVSSGGIDNKTTVISGNAIISSGGKAVSTTISKGGKLCISSGGTALDIIENGGNVVFENGADVSFAENVISDLILSSFESATIHSGTTANNVSVNNQGQLHVFSGGSVDNATVCALGRILVSSGGMADNTAVNENGLLHVSSGGTATFTTLDNNGMLMVFSSGTANNTLVNPFGFLIISSGGVANSTNITIDGKLTISSGGTATNTMLNGGSLRVFKGCLVNSTIINSGTLNISSGGIADGIIVASNASLEVSSGGTALNVVWTPFEGIISVDEGAFISYVSQYSGVYFGSGGQLLSNNSLMNDISVGRDNGMLIYSEGTANNLTIVSGGYVRVSSGGTINDTVVDIGGCVLVSSGGVTNDIKIYSGGNVYVSCGGITNSTTIKSLGNLYVSSGGIAKYDSNNGIFYISSGGIANYTANTGSIYVSSGGITINTMLNDYGTLNVLSDGLGSNTVVAKNGRVFVSSGGIVDNIIVSSGGRLHIASGGTAINISWTPFTGKVLLEDGACATFASQYVGIYYGSSDQLLSHDNEMESKIVSQASMFVMSGGTATETTVNNWGSMWVSNGGTAINTFVSDGDIFVFSGGTAINPVVAPGAKLHIASGGTAINISWTPFTGEVLLEDGACATFTNQYVGIYYGSSDQLLSHDNEMESKIVSQASMFVMSGGTATETTVNNWGSMWVSNGGIANRTSVESHGDLHVSNGATANRTTIEYGGLMFVSLCGVANDTFVNSGGILHISSGGTANSTFIDNVGKMIVSLGGTANQTTMNGGCLSVSNGGMIDDSTINHGEIYVSSGGTANNTTVDDCGVFYVSRGGVANNTNINSDGKLSIFDCGSANNTIVSPGGFLIVSSGGVANSTTINSGGTLAVSSAGSAEHTSVNSGAHFYVSNGATANATVVNSSGNVYVSDEGTANDTTIYSQGTLYISSGGKANGANVKACGVMCVSSEGIATGLLIDNKGELLVSSGGTAISASVCSGGNLIVSDGGVASYAIVSNGGVVRVSSNGTFVSATVQSGGIVTGFFNYKDVSFAAGTTLFFDISDIEPDNSSAIVNLTGFSEMQECPSCAIVVADSQKNGIYKLADNAWGFNQSISVVNSVIQLASTNLSIGQTVRINDHDYSLSLADGDLVLDIKASEPQYVYLDFNGENEARYNNADLNLSFNLSVQDPKFTEIQRQTIFDELSKKYKGDDIVFVLDRPKDLEYSTLYFGQSNAFDQYGEFFGISETNDDNNQDKNDNAYILLNHEYSTEQIVSVTSHVLNHLLGYYCKSDRNIDLREYAENKYFLTSKWRQGSPYNKYCPIDSTGGRSVTGCSATAAAQIINYWIEMGMIDFSLILEDSDADYPYSLIDNSSAPKSGHLSFAETNKLLSEYTLDDEDSIAALCFAAGVVLQSRYSEWETGASWKKELFYRSGFEDVFWDVWGILSSDFDRVIEELLQNRPLGIVIEAGISGIKTHAVVLDGYDSSSNSFHINYGWGGSQDGWYSFESLKKDGWSYTLFAIPPDASPNLKINSLLIEEKPVNSNEDITISFSVANTGKEKSKATMAYIYCGDLLLGATQVHFITPGSSRALTYTFSASSWPVGEHVLTVKVNSQEDEDTVSIASVTINCKIGDVPPHTQTWEKVEGAKQYIVEYSTDDFAHVLVVATPGTTVDTLNLPGGTYQWRVKDADDDSNVWAVGEPIESENDPGTAKVLRANGDGNYDLFFANACGTWEAGYVAQHVGSIDDWDGTKEYAAVFGKNKLADIFEGSDDANILLLTDDANGDALFVDDIYTELPGTLEEQQARIAQISEIHGGGGDDIIDMTSQRFEYIGGGIIIRGGDGNDVIWANKGGNWLFGDMGDDRIVGASGDDLIAGGIGDDRMHGGGGDDVFAFCENWGKDTVEQLAGGKVTLWFASGDETNWDADSLTYSDGENSVTVKGVTVEQIELKFGDDGSELFASLSDLDAFEAFTSRKIFEEAALA